MLVFESIVVSGHDEEYGRAESEIRPALRPRSARSSRSRATSARRSRASVIEQLNRSSVGVENRDADPQLAALEDVTAWRENVQRAARPCAAGSIRGGTGSPRRRTPARTRRSPCCRRAPCSTPGRPGARTRLSPRPCAQIQNPTRPRNEVDDIFADSGFGARQSLRPNGTRDDWCGMFVAASMFRGATLDKNVRMAFAHTDNVHDFFTYNRLPINAARTPLSIWAEGQWWGVREYHEQRGLARTWIEGGARRRRRHPARRRRADPPPRRPAGRARSRTTS